MMADTIDETVITNTIPTEEPVIVDTTPVEEPVFADTKPVEEPEMPTMVEPVIVDTTPTVVEPEITTVVEPEIPTVVEPEITTVVEPEIPTVVEPEIPTTEETVNTNTDDATIKLKPYRNIKYDEYDKKYATRMKTMYENVELHIKEQFDIFTEKLIDDNYISRNNLLDAIQDFTKQNNNKVKYILWERFTDEAFNYRPWQTCCIS